MPIRNWLTGPRVGWKMTSHTTATATALEMKGMKIMARNRERRRQKLFSKRAQKRPTVMLQGTTRAKTMLFLSDALNQLSVGRLRKLARPMNLSPCRPETKFQSVNASTSEKITGKTVNTE